MTLALPALSGLSPFVDPRGAPYAVANLAADFDADELLDSLSDTDPVTTWADATGNANDVGNTGSNRPTFDAANPQFNGHASVNFAKASTQYLFGADLPICTALSGTGKLWTAFVVYRRSTKVTAQETFLSLGNSGSAVNYQQARWVYANSNSQRPGASLRDGDGAADSSFQGQNEIVDLAAQVAVVTRGASAMTHHVVGGSQNSRFDALVDAITSTSGDAYGTQGAFTHDRLALGILLRNTASSPCDMEVARVLIYTRELDDNERATIADYLWRRYCRRTGYTFINSDVAHIWAASGATQNEGESCPSLSDSYGGKLISAPLSANRPTVRLHPSGQRYLEFDGSNDALQADTAADWTFLHDGSDWTIFVTYRPHGDAAALIPLVDTVDNDTVNNNGLGIYHDAASDAHSLQVKVGATNATPVLNHDSQDGAMRPDVWHVAAVSHEGSIPSSEENFQIYADNENYAAVDQGVTPSAGAPAYPLTVGSLGGLGTSGKFDFAELRIYRRKMGRSDVQTVCEALAAYYNTSHVAVVAGNGLSGILDENDATPHRAFPGPVWDGGRWIACYRRAADHGSSAGVCCMKTSGDAMQWTEERVIFDDSANYDWRGVNFIGRISTGRIFLGMALSETDSDLLPYTSGVLYTDDRGGVWSGPLFLSKQDDLWHAGIYSGTGLTWDEGVNSIVELGDGTLLAHFAAQVNGAVRPHILQCRSTNGGDSWSRPEIVYYGRSTGAGGDFPQDERIQEPCVVRFADGELLMAIRADTPNERIYFARSSDDGATWSPSTFSTEYIDGWGNPRMVVDPNDPDGVWLFHRLNTSANLAVWRYSDDRGATWTDPQPLTNFNDSATTTITDYAGMTYAYPAVDGDGNVWVAWGMENSDDGDVFMRRWANAPA